MTAQEPGFVRLALPREASDIATIQYGLMADPRHPLHALHEQTDAAQLAEVWHRSITRPPLATYRVLVATEGRTVVGMVAVGPSEDDDADAADGTVVDLMVTPGSRRQGHGTRLVQAAVDTLRADGFTRATWCADHPTSCAAGCRPWAGRRTGIPNRRDRPGSQGGRLHTSTSAP